MGNPLLTSLPSFSTLTRIGGTLHFFDNDALTTLPTFEGLTRLGGVFILNNAKLTRVSGFEGLTTIGGIFISGNTLLATVSGFTKLATVTNDITISHPFFSGNPALTRFPSFSSLTRIDGSLFVTRNDILPSIPSFSSLTSIGGGLFISGNAALTSVSGFEARSRALGMILIFLIMPCFRAFRALTSLETITGSLNIGRTFFGGGNPVLTSLPSFSSLTRIDGNLQVVRNEMLPSISGPFLLSQALGQIFLLMIMPR